MIWQNPWAWVGVVAVALPILIHLLGRGHARVQKFPTLRFLEPSKLLPTRRSRIHDLLLLLVRVAILLAAVAALAQPLLRATGKSSLETTIARAIVIDTSASMSRRTTSGERAIDAAKTQAKSLATEAPSSTTIETSNPARAIVGAAAWLDRQPSRGELVIVSDFQAGTIDSTSLASISASHGIELVKVASAPASGSILDSAATDRGVSVTRIDVAPNRTDVEWTSSGALRADSITVLASASERSQAAAAIAAARTIAVRLPLDAHAGDVAIVTRSFERRNELLARAGQPKQPWMLDLIVRFRSDNQLRRASADLTTLGADSAKGLVLARNANGSPVVTAVEDSADGHNRLLLVSSADAGSVSTASLVAATRRALSRATPLSELEPTTTPDDVLASWQRSPSASPVADTTNTGASDGRWLWAFALILLGVEMWLRRARPEPAAQERVQDRAA